MAVPQKCDAPTRQALLDEGIPDFLIDYVAQVKRDIEAAGGDWLDWIAKFKKWLPILIELFADFFASGSQAPKTLPKKP